jgi:hypothetical protein
MAIMGLGVTESTKAKKTVARKKKEESSDEEYAKIIDPMDDLVDDTVSLWSL